MSIHSHIRDHFKPDDTSKGIIIRWAGSYDAIAGNILNSSDTRIIELAGVKPGDTVVDLGCGPGRLTLKAKNRAGKDGMVYGIDASEEMIAVAQKKAAALGVEVVFKQGLAQALPFEDNSVDVVVSRLVFHHLPGDLKRQAFAEIRRVLKPGGICLIADLDLRNVPVVGRPLKHLLSFHTMGKTDVGGYVLLMEKAGFADLKTGSTGHLPMSYVKGKNV